jgi:plastocyanin
LTRRIAVAAAAIAGVLAIPASAGAATKVVSMGLTPAAQKTFQKYQADVNDFFPDGIKIHVGDSIKFVPNAFHSVDLPPKGGKAVPIIVPTGQNISGENDAAGGAFWFNGQPGLTFNGNVFTPAGGLGKSFTYNGSTRVESGAPITPSPKPMIVKFTKVGSYRYFCDIHPGMSGVVHVVAKTAKTPSAKADAKALAKQVARDLKTAKGLTHPTTPANTVDLGSAGRDGVEVFAFLPGTLNVPTGTTVTFRMSPKSREVHTATTGPGNPDDPTQTGTYLGKLEASLNSPAPDPAVFYPSDPPGGPISFSSSSHGNGFWNSGALDAISASPLPNASSVTFSAPGTYTFYCLIHPFMKGTVVVS